MRLDNPALVPQHEQPGLLFWSASLVGNNEWGAQWCHTGNRPHFWLRIGHAGRVWICVFCAWWWVVCVCVGVCSFPPLILSAPLAVSPRTKGQRSSTLLRMAAQHCLKIHSHSPGAWLNCQPTNQPTHNAHSFTKPQGSLKYRHVWNSWYVHIQGRRDGNHTACTIACIWTSGCDRFAKRGFPALRSVNISSSEWQECQHAWYQ